MPISSFCKGEESHEQLSNRREYPATYHLDERALVILEFGQLTLNLDILLAEGVWDQSLQQEGGVRGAKGSYIPASRMALPSCVLWYRKTWLLMWFALLN